MRIKNTLIAAGITGLVMGFGLQTAHAGLPPDNPTIVGFTSTTVTATWGLPAGASMAYTLEASTFSDFSQVLSSVTPNITLSTLTLSGLTPNTTFFTRVGAVYFSTTNYAGTTPPSVLTWAAVPGTPNFGSVGISSMTLTWGANGNSSFTPFEISQSTHSNFSAAVSTPVPFNANLTATTTAIFNLDVATTYYFRLRAQNGDGVITNFSSIAGQRTNVASAPTGLTGAALGTTSIQWTWTAVSSATAYNLYISTPPTTLVANVVSPTYTEPGLSTNTLYGRVVTAIVNSGESGFSTAASSYTLAAAPGAPTFSGVGNSSMTLNWSSSGNPSYTPYELSQSTDASFATAVSTTIAFVSNYTSTATLISGLNPSTTYYFRVRAKNGGGVITAFGPVSSHITSDLPPAAPTGLNGSPLATTSIAWAWTAVSSATAYNLYVASSPATLITNVVSPAYTETGLSSNTAYGRKVTAIASGLESALSASVTTYTLAAVPGTPTFSGVGSSSMTTSWSPRGNNVATMYELSRSTDPTFATAVSTPVFFNLNVTAVTSVGLDPATTFYFRVRAANGNGIITDFSGIGAQVTKPSVAVSSGSGVGTAVVAPASAQQASVSFTTVTFTVPAGGMSAGGRLQMDLPPGWGPSIQTTNSGQTGYVAILGAQSTDFTVSTLSGQSVLLTLTSASLAPGTQVQVAFQGLYTNCPYPASQTQTAWTVKSAMTSTDALSTLTSPPNGVTLTKGPFQSLNFVPWSVVTVAINQPSSAIVLQPSDGCGQPVTLPSPLTINLSGMIGSSFSPDSGAQFSTVSNFATSATSVVLQASSTAVTFYYKTSTPSSQLWMHASYVHPIQSFTATLVRPVNALSSAFSFANASVDNGTAVSGQTTMTLSPDGDGVNDIAYIRFNPSDTSLNWRVVVSTDGFQYNVFERWGSSEPLSSLAWDGRDYHNGSVVANDTYAVKLEIPGLTSSTGLSITVNTAQISGTVTLGGSPVANAQINAQSVNSSGYAFARTDSNGNYVLYGLKASGLYNLYAHLVSSSTQAQLQGSLSNVPAGATGRNFAFSNPGLIRISAVAPSSTTATVFGSVNVYVPNTNQNFWGNIRILAGSLTSDNGDYFNPSSWTILGLPPGVYTVHPNIQGYGASDLTALTVLAGQTTDIILPLTPRASLYGKVTLPSPATLPQWVSVQGVRQGATTPSVFGGASFSVGQSSAIYAVYAVASGTYTLTSQIQGFVPQQLTGVIVGSTDRGDPVNGGLDFTGFTVGGHISGTLTINGNTTGQTAPFTMWLSAFSAQLGQNAFTQIQMPTSSTQTAANYTIGGLANGTYEVYPPYLSGFSASPPGSRSVTVSANAATLNLTLNENTGRIAGNVLLPSGHSDYGQVHLSLQGPVSVEQDLSTPSYEVTGLDTGHYSLVATYLTSGAQIRTNVSVVNGQTRSLDLELNGNTYTVSGQVSVQSGFTMIGTSGTVVVVNTLSDLLAAATEQMITLGGTSRYNGPSVTCVGGSTTTLSTVRVEAFPKTFNSFNQANRSGTTSCFGVGEYRYGTVNSSGAYAIEGLGPGLWEINVYPYFDNGTVPNVAVQKKVVSILSANPSAVNFALASGNSVSGTVSLPDGLTDTRSFDLQIISDRGDAVQSATLDIGSAGSPAASASFAISHLAAGNYSVQVVDRGTFDSTLNRTSIKYVAKPVQFQISGGDVTDVAVNVTNASRIVGKIVIQGANPDGSPSLTLITPSNISLLSDNFFISAQANPWVPSGYGQAARRNNGPGVDINADNQFSIDGLIAATYDVMFQQNSFGASAQGSLNLANTTQGGVVLAQGQTMDLGTITLQPGLSLSGTVTDTNGVALPNIRVRAQPSNSQNGRDGQESFTNSAGIFTFTGLSPKVKIYDFVAAPRPSPNENVLPVPYGQAKKLAVDVTVVNGPALTFVLPTATARLTGTIATADGGPLSYPTGEREGYPAAAIFLMAEGNKTADNPLGDENATDLNGAFDITNLPAGIYSLTVECLGYRPLKLTGIALTNTTKTLGTLTLQKGPSLVVTLAKPDGSAVNTSDVRQTVAVSADLNSIIFGQINSDANTGNILSMKYSGFELSPKTYSILLFDAHDNIIVPADGKGILFTAVNDSASRAITFQPTAPAALVNIQKSGTDVDVTYYFSRPLRNSAADQDPSVWVSLLTGLGTLSDITLSGDRRQLHVTYAPANAETSATLRFSAFTVDINPATNTEYALEKTTLLLLGQKATAEQTINPALGGEVSLSDSLDASNVSIPGNALLSSTGSVADATTSYAFTFSATDDPDSIGAGALSHAPRVASMMSRGPGAYLSEAYAAMKAARTQVLLNPLSSFYSILLPTGLSHTLNQTASLTLHYESGADPATINVYYFNGAQYLLEQNDRVIDTTNRTITVSVSHFSTFVVLENSSPFIEIDGDVASTVEIEAFNFPNPFNLKPKTKTLTHGRATTTLTTQGTIIRYIIPASKAGAAKIDIYNVIGEKVRSLNLGSPSTDTYNYVEWDGENSSGEKVASGVYIGMLKVGSDKKFFKMAVIK